MGKENLSPSRDVWDGLWERSTVPRPIHTHLHEAIGRAVNLRYAMTLEVGCGSAVDSAEMAARGARAFAIDYAWQALRYACTSVTQKGQVVWLTAGDTFHLPFAEGTFDIVFSQGLVEHFADPVPAIREQTRVLRPGGFLCVDVPQKWSLARLNTWYQIRRGTWFAGWETAFSLVDLETLFLQNNLRIMSSYGWMYFPALLFGIRNLHTLDERHHVPMWIDRTWKQRVESFWRWLEHQRWYYRWLACVGVIGQKKTMM